MKRDFELIRTILEQAERANGERSLRIGEIEGHSAAEVEYHVCLCADAGFFLTDFSNNVYRLTWKGHDYLDRLRSSDPTGDLADRCEPMGSSFVAKGF